MKRMFRILTLALAAAVLPTGCDEDIEQSCAEQGDYSPVQACLDRIYWECVRIQDCWGPYPELSPCDVTSYSVENEEACQTMIEEFGDPDGCVTSDDREACDWAYFENDCDENWYPHEDPACVGNSWEAAPWF